MVNVNEFNDVHDKLIDIGKKKGFLSKREIKSMLPTDSSEDNIRKLIYSLEESGIDIVDEIDEEKTSREISPKEPINLGNIFVDDESEIATNIKDCENKLIGYRQQLRNIEAISPIPIKKLNDIGIAIFLEEEKIRGLQEKLISANRLIVSTITNEYLQRNSFICDKNDLMQQGYLGLMIAVREFKFNSDNCFKTFTASHIRNAIDEILIEDAARNTIGDYIKTNIALKTDLWEQADLPVSQGFEKTERIGKRNKNKDKRKSTIQSTNESKDSISDTSKTLPFAQSDNVIEYKPNTLTPLINIPNLMEVKPTVTHAKKSLLVTKLKKHTSKYRHSLESKPTIDSFLDKINLSLEDTPAPLNSHIPKLYSRLRFDNDRRLSIYAKRVGERAEEIVIKYLYETLQENEKSTMKWTSKRGETPGWDIEYHDSTNKLMAIEVKGTTGNSFPNIEITGNEWEAAIELKERYWIYLVTKCFSTDPQIQRIENPFQQKEAGVLDLKPILWRIELISEPQ